MEGMKKLYYEYWKDSMEHETLYIILSGHLVIEHLLEEAIKTQLRQPKEIDLSRLNFPNKVELCVSFGILHPRKKAVYLKLNTLRNKFAHRLDYEISFDDAFQYAKEMTKALFAFSEMGNDLNKDFLRRRFKVNDMLAQILDRLSTELIGYLFDHEGKKCP